MLKAKPHRSIVLILTLCLFSVVFPQDVKQPVSPADEAALRSLTAQYCA